jgi:hypothetical protein
VLDRGRLSNLHFGLVEFISRKLLGEESFQQAGGAVRLP